MKKSLSITLKVISVFYIILLFWGFLVYQNGSYYWTDVSFLTYVHGSANLIPFKTFFELVQTPGAQNVPVILYTFWLNFLAFLPFGVLFYLNFPDKKIEHCAIAAAALTVLISIAKLVFRAGSFDMDDIIVGTVAAVLAFFLTKLVGRRLHPAT